MSVQSANPYTQMQVDYYESTADLMNQENHRIHNGNQDYWDILVGDTESGYRHKVGLDFGCGCGRNVQNLWWRFRRMDGVDLSFGNLVHANENLREVGATPDRFRLHQANGVDLSNLAAERVRLRDVDDRAPAHRRLRHPLPVPPGVLPHHEARRPALVPDGLRRGPGQGGVLRQPLRRRRARTRCTTRRSPTRSRSAATSSRSASRTSAHAIRPAFDDGHEAWIYVKAYKPAD